MIHHQHGGPSIKDRAAMPCTGIGQAPARADGKDGGKRRGDAVIPAIVQAPRHAVT
jgi:hypothetical protein